MPSWPELESQFRELSEPMRLARVDYRWGGGVGTGYELYPGHAPIQMSKRFEVLAAIAGQKLREVPSGLLNELVMMRGDPRERWYEALKHHSGVFKPDIVATVTDGATGAFKGHINTGWVLQPAEASALLALELSAQPLAVPTPAAKQQSSRFARASAWVTEQSKNHKALWGLIGFLVLAVLGLLGVIFH